MVYWSNVEEFSQIFVILHRLVVLGLSRHCYQPLRKRFVFLQDFFVIHVIDLHLWDIMNSPPQETFSCEDSLCGLLHHNPPHEGGDTLDAVPVGNHDDVERAVCPEHKHTSEHLNHGSH